MCRRFEPEVVMAAECSLAVYREDSEAFMIVKGDAEVGIFEGANTIYIAYRGTEFQFGDILTDLRTWPKWLKGGLYHRGFYNRYKTLKDKVDVVIRYWKAKGYRIVVTGHSLGGAVAMMHGQMDSRVDRVVAFAPVPCMRLWSKYTVDSLYFKNKTDPVPRVSVFGMFKHYGDEVQFGKGAPMITGFSFQHFLLKDIACHSMEKYLLAIRSRNMRDSFT